MASLKMEVTFDIKELMLFYNKGLQDGFMLANEENESDLYETLNLNNISKETDGEE